MRYGLPVASEVWLPVGMASFAFKGGGSFDLLDTRSPLLEYHRDTQEKDELAEVADTHCASYCSFRSFICMRCRRKNGVTLGYTTGVEL